MTQTPDTSPANVARVLRDTAGRIEDGRTFGLPSDLRVLADALDALPTWEERVERAIQEIHPGIHHLTQTERDRMSRALRAAFPELAPTDD